ncbi:MAG: hypothetical protein LBU91_04335 [Bacteroidales bacterium]|jgi:hypothetical protein|nr:hypothetical protein [Bacteroidales bacterium]
MKPTQTPPKNNTTSKFNPFAIGVGLLAIPVFSLVVTTLFWICGLSMSPIIFPLAIALSLGLVYVVSEKNSPQFFYASCSVLGIIIGSLILSAFTYDYSYDGQWYHQEIISQLKNGWNPIYKFHAPDASRWVNHYAKGLETVSATIYSMTGNIETGKAVNLLLVFASAFLFFTFLKTCFETLSFKKKILLTFLFVFCPVVGAQIFTFKNDFAGYALLLTLVPSLILLFRKQSKYNLFIIGAVVFLACVIKFNWFFWILFAVFCYLVYMMVIKRYDLLKKIIITCMISSIVAVFIVGFNPYVTNIIDHKNPFYLVIGEGRVDTIDQFTPSIQNKARVGKVLTSLCSYPNLTLNETSRIQEDVKWAFPWNLRFSHFRNCAVDNTRIGGFGVFFCWSFVLSLALYGMVAFRKNKLENNINRIHYDIFLLILFLSLFILPLGWWARFVPFFWAFPLVMLLYSERENKIKSINLFRTFIYFLLVINTSVFLSTGLLRGVLHKITIDKTIRTLEKSDEPVLINFGDDFAFKIKLEHRNIPYQATSEQLKTLFPKIGSPRIMLDSEKYAEENNVLVEKKHPN